MIIKKKIIIFEKFGILELFFSIFFVLKFNKIYFLKKNFKLNSNLLKILKIYQLDYEKLNNDNSDLLIKVKKNCDKVLEFLKKQKSYYYFLSGNNRDYDFFEAAYLKNMYNEILSITEIIEFSRRISSSKKIFFYTNKIKLFSLLNETTNKNIYFLSISKFKFFNFNFFFVILKNLFSILNIFFRSTSKKNLEHKKIKTIYFPHKGIHYANLYLKNQFYDKDIKSIFYKKNIIHSSFDYEGNLDKASLNYYKKNKIIYQNWSLNKFSKFFFISFFLSHKHLKSLSLYSEFDYNLLIVLFKYHYHTKILDTKFSQIKYLLIAYDFLFPSELLLIANQRNIISITHNERIIQSYWNIESPIKFNLAIGNPIIKNSKYSLISNYILSGPIRLSFFLENKKNLKQLTSLKKNKFSNSKICLVLDWESEINEYNNKRKFANNWRNNFIFYNDIYKIALINKDIIFLIKGKTNNSLKIRFYNDLFSKLFKLKNVFLIYNKDKLSYSYNALFVCDYLIGLHTSLIDEAIFIEKKLMIYDKFNLLDKMNYYTRSILIKNDYDLIKKSSFLFNNPYETKKLIKKNKQLIFGNLTQGKILKKYDIFKKSI